MLSRTADCLYWMARYTERAENTARMLDVNHQTSLLPQPAEFLEQSWKKLLTISKLEDAFLSNHDVINRENVLDFMIYETSNPSSIVSCLYAARENARVIRGKITSEVWETQNTTWLELQRILEARHQADPSRLLEWVKHRCHLFRGVFYGTMLKNEAFYFINAGTLLERADNTARILETKYEYQDTQKVLDPKKSSDNGAGDEFFNFYHWAALLRSVSAFEIYRQIYSDQVTPKQVAQLLIFNKQMPRSLVCCVNELIPLISEMKNQQSKEIERLLGKLKASLDQVYERDHKALEKAGIDFNCNMIFGGQVKGEKPRLFNIYSAGNFIESTPETCYFQIGESKYGKPILDRVLTFTTPLNLATKCALISMDSTLKSNISVGLPLDMLVYERNSLKATKLVTLDDANPYFAMIHQLWGEKLREAFNSISEPSWSGAHKSSDISIPAKKMGAVPINHPPSKTQRSKLRTSIKTSKSVKKGVLKKVAPKKK